MECVGVLFGPIFSHKTETQTNKNIVQMKLQNNILHTHSMEHKSPFYFILTEAYIINDSSTHIGIHMVFS